MRSSVYALALAFALSGCANLNSIDHRFKTGKGESLTVDAKQRAVFTVIKTPPGIDRWTAICAEPSPDALSALSTSVGLDAAE